MKKVILLFFVVVSLHAEKEDYTLMIGPYIGSVSNDKTYLSVEGSFSYNLFEDFESLLFGVSVAGGKAIIGTEEYSTIEYLGKIDYAFDLPVLLSVGYGSTDYRLNNITTSGTIASVSLTYHTSYYILENYATLDYRLIRFNGVLDQELFVIHFGIYL